MKKSVVHSIPRLALIPLLLSVAKMASASISCSPVALSVDEVATSVPKGAQRQRAHATAVTTVRPGSTISLVGHCVDSDTNAEPTRGSEHWFLIGGEGAQQQAGQRSLPNGTLTVTVPTLPGEYTYQLPQIDDGYGGLIDTYNESPIPSVTIAVANEATPTPEQATLGELTTPLTTLQTTRVRNHLNDAQSHLRTLRSSKSSSTLDFYTSGLGDYLRQEAAANQSEFKVRTTTLSVGADYRLNDDWVLGGNLGLSHSHVRFSDSESDQKSNGNHATAYTSWSLSPSTYLSATVSYEASRFDVKRDDGTGIVSYSSPKGHGLGISLSGGRDFVMGAWTFGPYVRWDSVTSNVDAFDENGSASAVSVSSQRTRSNSLNLGAQTQLSVPVSWGIVLPYVRVEYSHRSDSTQRAAGAKLLSDNTALLVPTAVDTSGSFGSIAAGISGVNQGGMSWFADFESGLWQKGYRTQRFGLGVRFEL